MANTDKIAKLQELLQKTSNPTLRQKLEATLKLLQKNEVKTQKVARNEESDTNVCDIISIINTVLGEGEGCSGCVTKGTDCGENKYLLGFNNNGDTICKNLQGYCKDNLLGDDVECSTGYINKGSSIVGNDSDTCCEAVSLNMGYTMAFEDASAWSAMLENEDFYNYMGGEEEMTTNASKLVAVAFGADSVFGEVSNDNVGATVIVSGSRNPCVLGTSSSQAEYDGCLVTNGL